MTNEDIQLVEAILFIENKPLSVEALKKMALMKEREVANCLEALKKKYDDNESGLELEMMEDGYAFVPRKSLYERLRNTYGKKVDSRLSRAAIETLSIVAYEQDVTRRDIEKIRGVSSDAIVKILKDRGFLKVTGRSDTVGRPCTYGTTDKFLEEFNLNSIADLPAMTADESERFEEKDENGRIITQKIIRNRRRKNYTKEMEENETISLSVTPKEAEKKEDVQKDKKNNYVIIDDEDDDIIIVDDIDSDEE